jgi:hypothetical protein
MVVEVVTSGFFLASFVCIFTAPGVGCLARCIAVIVFLASCVDKVDGIRIPNEKAHRPHCMGLPSDYGRACNCSQQFH